MLSVSRRSGATGEKFSKLLKEYRERRRFTQKDAVKHLGISMPTLQNWEIAHNMPRGIGLRVLVTTLERAGSRPRNLKDGRSAKCALSGVESHFPRTMTATPLAHVIGAHLSPFCHHHKKGLSPVSAMRLPKGCRSFPTAEL